MNLSFLNRYLESNSRWKRLEKDLVNLAEIRISVPGASKPLLIYSIYKKLSLPILLVTSDIDSAKALYTEVQNQFSELGSLYYFPETSNGSVTSEKDLSVKSERSKVLSNLYYFQNSSLSVENAPIVITSLKASTEKIIQKSRFIENMQVLNIGMALSPTTILQKWQNLGYEIEEVVEIPGNTAHRGGILDIFPFDSEYPIRIELEGNQIISIRQFDPKTQRSIKNIQTIAINSARDEEENSDGTIFDYFPENSLAVIDNFEEIVSKFDVDPKKEEVERVKNKFLNGLRYFGRCLYLVEWVLTDNREKGPNSSPFLTVPKYGGRLEQFIKDLKKNTSVGYSVFIISQQADRLEELLRQKDIAVNRIRDGEKHDISGDQGIILEKGSISEGWMLKDTIVVFGDNEIFGWLKQQRSYKKRAIRHHILLNQLDEGDYVVHVDHGIGKFAGLVKLSNDGSENEYLVLEYASGDKLYVPVDQIDRVGRYIGGNDQIPALSRLNTQEWAQTKIRIKKSVQDIAEELLKVQAARETADGFSFSGDTIWQQEMESSFPYIETLDQLEAIKDVKRDMEQPRPMDRLICGDVGYGKTEIALRAAFKAVMDNKQVAILVPTTVLAQQHFITFKERLQAFPVNLAVLSRFYSDKEQKDVIDGLAKGSVDICIGTHRLLQKDITFKDLGLLIIDEEQRFGVVHKEYLKKLRKEVDVLTLSATPIPRTLNMALSSIKDLSTLETPPEERLPIKTFVGPFDKSQIREAILREIRRGGQVFYVHNRVHNIHSAEKDLGELVPEARISVAHGQMDEAELEKVMSGFVCHESDILLTTTIIESGIDIARANTLIIDDSDRLGLTQLYQLRGRIGRGSNNAFAYLFFNKFKQLTEQARKRLKTIEDATELGSGFAIAMKDLEIRGAGNILGSEQSGYIAAVGFDLYCRLLADAVRELRFKLNGKQENIHAKLFSKDVTVSLGLKAFIPEYYVPDEKTRIDFYRRLTSAEGKELNNIREEFIDRFGEIPLELKNLFYIIEIKRLASTLDIESVIKKDYLINLVFTGKERLSQNQKIMVLETKYKQFASIGNAQLKLDITSLRGNWQHFLKDVLSYLS